MPGPRSPCEACYVNLIGRVSAWNMDIAQEWQMQVGGMAGEKRVAKQEGAQSRQTGNDESIRYPAMRPQAQVRFYPDRAE